MESNRLSWRMGVVRGRMKLVNPLLYQRIYEENTYSISELAVPIEVEDVTEESEETDENK